MDISTIAGFVLGLGGAALGSAGVASSEEPSTLSSYLRARKVIERAASVLGSERDVPVSFRAAGTIRPGAERQGRTPASLDPAPFSEKLAWNPSSDRVAYEYRHDRRDGTLDWVRESYENEDDRLITVPPASFAVRLVSPRHRSDRKRLVRRFPHLLLRETLERPGSLRSLGRRDEGEAVAATLEDGTTLTLVFDDESGVLRRAEYLTDVQTLGDTEVAWSFDAYEPVRELGLFPRAYGVSVAGRPFTSMRVEQVHAGAEAGVDLFRLPEGIEPVRRELAPGEDASAGAKVVEIEPGIYQIANLRLGFSPLFVELADSVVAIDAPAGYRLLNEIPAGDVAPGPSSSWLSERYLQLIRETVPHKPVSHVVLTHFHNDHAGGLRAFVRAGAALVAPPGDVEAIETLVRDRHTLAPDGGASTELLRIEEVRGRLVLGDAGRSVEILDVGPNPHTEEMLVVWVPEESLMFVSDLLSFAPLDAFPDPAHAALDVFFVRWLDERGLAPKRIYTMHGGGPVTPAHLDALRERGRPR